MAEVTLKRQREVEEEVTEGFFKRQKSYEDILSILDEEEEDPAQDLSSLITTLQQEISSNPQMSTSSSEADLSLEDESERVMKHLLEASDDELGIPNAEAGDQFGGSQGTVSLDEFDGGDLLLQPAADGFGDGLLWEIEDEAANYYALMQSELFL